jgi:hypothetical protein
MNTKTKLITSSMTYSNQLNQQRFGMLRLIIHSDNKFTANGEFSFYNNEFIGNQLSPVAFTNARRIASRKKQYVAITFAEKS